MNIPRGWKLVPDGIESLPVEMFDAGNECFTRLGGFNPYSIYQAMLRAAPEPPPINLPFERLPQCGCDPGTGDTPPPCTCGERVLIGN